MSQSYANTNSFPLDLGFESPQIEWAWTKFVFKFDLSKESIRFLRYPDPEQGLGYRIMRSAVIFGFQIGVLGMKK